MPHDVFEAPVDGRLEHGAVRGDVLRDGAFQVAGPGRPDHVEPLGADELLDHLDDHDGRRVDGLAWQPANLVRQLQLARSAPRLFRLRGAGAAIHRRPPAEESAVGAAARVPTPHSGCAGLPAAVLVLTEPVVELMESVQRVSHC